MKRKENTCEYRVVRERERGLRRKGRKERETQTDAAPFVIVLAVWSKIFSVML